MIFVELLYTHELNAKSKIINVINVTGQPTVKRKIDHGKDFNDYCLIPITNICRVLVLDPTDFTALFLFVFQLTVWLYCAAHHGSTPHNIATSERY